MEKIVIQHMHKMTQRRRKVNAKYNQSIHNLTHISNPYDVFMFCVTSDLLNIFSYQRQIQGSTDDNFLSIKTNGVFILLWK